MRTAGIYLIYAAVAFRALVRFADLPQRDLVAALLAIYGLFLVIERLAIQPSPHHYARGGEPEPGPDEGGRGVLSQGWPALLYLLVQYGIVFRLLLVPPHVDFMAGLFIPLSLQAVLYYGRQIGFFFIGIFMLTIPGPLLAAQEGLLFAPTMAIFFGGLCFLYGGYALQVHKAETAQKENQRMLDGLQDAHQRLQGFATQVEDLAVERERIRMARELHDSVTQLVFSMNLAVQTSRYLWISRPNQVPEQLDRVEDLARQATVEIKTLVSELRPRLVIKEGLPAALQRLAAERQIRDDLRVTLEVKGERILPEPVAVGLYRITQEALNNVVRHAGTSQATIRLRLVEGQTCLEIEDQGCGFDPEKKRDQGVHLGLTGMAERARELGWNLVVESCPGSGTRIRVAEALKAGVS